MKHNSVFFQSIKIILSMTMAAVILCCSICSAAAEVEILEFDDEDFRNGNFDNSDYVPKGDRVIVSLGDSYSTGEGIEKFYSQDRSLRDRINDQDWRGHRSENSWPGQLRLNGVEGEMRDEKNRNSAGFSSPQQERQQTIISIIRNMNLSDRLPICCSSATPVSTGFSRRSAQ